MKAFRAAFFAMLLLLTLGVPGLQAHAQQVRCSIVHNEGILKEIQRLQLEQAQWENEPGRLNQLKLSIVQRLLGSGAIKNFDQRVYNGHLLTLLRGDARPSDANVQKFAEGRLAILEFLNLSSNRLMTPESFLKDIESARLMRQRKVAKLLQKMDLTGGITREFLDSFSADFFLATRGIPEKASDFILKSSDERTLATWSKMFQEQALERGLRRIALETPQRDLTIRENLSIKLRTFLRLKLFRFLASFPAALPGAKDPILSEDLMIRVMLDGMPAHRAAIEAELASQGNWSTYNRLRRLWTPLMAGALMYLTYPAIYEQMQVGVLKEINQQMTQQREQVRHDFQKGIDQIDSAAKYARIQDVMQKTNRYLETARLLGSEWRHRDWEKWEVEAFIDRAYGNMITSEIRSAVLSPLPTRLSENQVLELAQHIEYQVLSSQGLILQPGVLP